LNAGKIVTLPRYGASEDQYVACQIKDTRRDLGPGRFGILEPLDSCPTFDLNRLDFSLVPGLGFTLSGYRLGRGKGYYDRLLAKVPGVKCGVAFAWQAPVELVPEAHDIRLDYILTPALWHPVRGEGGILE
jgi:5-formyltetrahydrofolate cyclo-ligase